jgi:hypothetical protein
MSYRLSKFGTTALPCARMTATYGTGPTVDATIPVIGGMYDAYTTATGYTAGIGNLDVPYELTHGCWIVDTEADAQTTLDSLYAMRGTRNILYRYNETPAIIENPLSWCWARCIQVRNPWQWQRKTLNPLDITFQVQTPWYGALTGTGWSLDPGATLDATLIGGESPTTLDIIPKAITLTNYGNVATRHVSFKVKAHTAIIYVDVQIDLNSRFRWTGTIPAGQTLQVIQRQDYAAITKNGTAAYNGFVNSASLWNGWWLELQPGANTAYVTVYGGDGQDTITFDHADGWA